VTRPLLVRASVTVLDSGSVPAVASAMASGAGIRAPGPRHRGRMVAVFSVVSLDVAVRDATIWPR